MARFANILNGGDGHVMGGPVGVPPSKPGMEDAARLIPAFLADPASVLRGGLYAMTASNAFVNANFKDAPRLGNSELGGPDYYFFDQQDNAAIDFYQTHPVFPGVLSIEVVVAEEEGAAQVQFLPWRVAKLTYCKLDDDAHLVLTGPLNGCSVFLVEITGRGEEDGTYLFHVNANESGRTGSEAAKAQGRKFGTALDRLWPDASERTVTHQLTSVNYRSTIEDTQVNGLVYGTRSSSGRWDFFYYFIDFGPTGGWTKRDTMPLPLPRI
jgi:hypothetical protein